MNSPDKNKIQKILQAKLNEVEQIDQGNGGNSWVFKYKAEDKFFAIKILRRFDRYSRFKEEVSVASELSNEIGICPILNSNLPSIPNDKSYLNLPFFIMPFFSNGSLENRILGPAQDTGEHAMCIFKQIVQIINRIHKRGFAYRDLKPENILIGDKDELYVSDFGLCLDLTKESLDRTTKQEEIVGSFYYRPPEYLRGRLDMSDHRPGDVFSLGRILWSLIIGKQPIGLTDWEFSKKGVTTIVSNLRKSYLIEELISNCSKVDPLKRPTTEEILKVIDQWEYIPASHSVDAVKVKILSSTELPKIKEMINSAQELMKMFDDFGSFGLKILQEHKVFSQMSDVITTAFPERKLNAGISVQWFSELKDTVKTREEKVVACGFSLGNLQLMPALLINCNFQLEPLDRKVLFEVVAGVIDKNEKKEIWQLEPVKFYEFDAKAMIIIEKNINLGMEQINKWFFEKT